MFARVHSIAVSGLSGTRLDVEVDIGAGLPAFSIVGLPDLATQESRERVRSAIRNSGYQFPIARIVVNLAPADLRKKGAFDLPIALAVIQKEIPLDPVLVSESVFLGELALDGTIRPTASVLPCVLAARELGFARAFVPVGNVAEAATVPGIDVVGVATLRGATECLSGERPVVPTPHDPAVVERLRKTSEGRYPDFASVLGQSHAKRALLIAAAGGHNILLSGPPGSGKTMLAEAFAGIQPSMTFDEMLEVSKIYSVTGLLGPDMPLVVSRPFRRVHHTASGASVVGGGRDSRPGEISLAHRGTLFFDELLEFDQRLLEMLRQPLEDGEMTINRVSMSATYPARFLLVAAMNPCPCGYLGDPEISCRDSAASVERYRRKLSGPLLDRIDLVVHVPRLKTTQIAEARHERDATGSSAAMRERVEAARGLQRTRFVGMSVRMNGEMDNAAIERSCVLTDEARTFLDRAVDRLSLSTRAYFRLLRVARTIADLAESSEIGLGHVSEALSYRAFEQSAS